MKLKFQLLFAFLCFLSFQSIQAQNLTRFIPADAGMVFGVDFGNLSKKANWDKIRQMDFYKDMMEKSLKSMPSKEASKQFEQMMNDASSIGVNTKEKAYFFMTPKGENNYSFGFVFGIGNKTKFSNFVKEQLQKEMKMINVKTASNYEYFINKSMGFAWNSEVAMLLSEMPGSKTNESKDRMDAGLEMMIKEAMVGNPNNSILKNKRYTTSSLKPFDFNTWLDYEVIMKSANSFAGAANPLDPSGGKMMDAMQSLYKDTYIYMDMGFEKGRVDLDSRYFMNKEMIDLWKGVTDVKMNKKFTKYIPKKGLLGYWGMAYNMEKLAESMKSIGSKMLGKDMPNVAALITESLHKMGINMDDKALFQMMKGDAVFAITGVNQVEREVTTFEYDEDFNKTEVKKMVKSPLPEFVLMMSYSNKNDLMKFVFKGEEMGMLEKKANHYLIKAPGMPMEVSLAMHDGMLFVSNNNDLIANKLKKGYAKKDRISKVHRKMLKKNSQVLYWDIKESITVANTMDENLDRKSGGLMNVGRQNFESLIMTAPKKVTDYFDSTISLNLSNKKEHSIEQLFGLMNDFYINMMGTGKSM